MWEKPAQIRDMLMCYKEKPGNVRHRFKKTRAQLFVLNISIRPTRTNAARPSSTCSYKWKRLKPSSTAPESCLVPSIRIIFWVFLLPVLSLQTSPLIFSLIHDGTTPVLPHHLQAPIVSEPPPYIVRLFLKHITSEAARVVAIRARLTLCKQTRFCWAHDATEREEERSERGTWTVRGRLDSTDTTRGGDGCWDAMNTIIFI